MPLEHVKHFSPHGAKSRAAVSHNISKLSHEHPEMSRAQRVAIAFHAAGERSYNGKHKKKKHLQH